MLDPKGGARRVTIVLRSLREERGGYTRLLEELQRLGAAEATVFQGVASFVGQHPIHTNRALDFAPELPVVIMWIDGADRVDAILPQIMPLIKDGIVTVDDTTVALHTSTEIADLPAGERVSDVMTPDPRYVRPETPMSEMVDILARQRFRALPVVDGEMRAVGIVTNGDLVRRGGLPLRLELLQAMPEDEQRRKLEEARSSAHTAADIMTRDPVTVPASAGVREAAELMLRHRLKRLPVVGGDGKLAGMVSRVDVLRTVAGPRAGAYADGAPGIHESASAPVSRVMTTDVPTVRPDDPVPHLINVVVSTRLNRAVVVDEGRRPLGIVSDAEVIERVTPEAREPMLTAIMRRLPLLHGSEESQQVARHAHGRAARDFLRTDFLRVDETTPIADVLGRMLEEGRKVAVVVDAQGILRGMADRRDLLAALA